MSNELSVKPAMIAPPAYAHLLRIAELPPYHVLLNITPTAKGCFVVNDSDLVRLAELLEIPPAELRNNLEFLSKNNLFSRFLNWTLKKYANSFPPLPSNLSALYGN